ncbi:tRNA threonylcarbamoyladenosine dehydratase isoform X3 [Nicotiana sylvestris]|uniref:tRNA threonylcarbamoyladenosine dehydratase isoform X3 n=1 Tax=Nicotiana sylvestris TaxID=4096 RepID=A0A1U7WWX7_NICSY|nr:PREDICTED: tRNA threonylcarbamoyladenosine dehydratase isoform X3 [Nicotiana sylvestris]
MEEKVKILAIIGAGAVLGSAATLAISKLLSNPMPINNQSVGKEYISEAVNSNELPQSKYNGMATPNLLTDEVVSEQLTRNIQFFGLEAQQKVTASYVVVIGLGGVGSHAASMLLRSGVGRLLLVDFDQVTVSSLNRHAVATREDVGTPKALCLKKHFQSIFPECHINAKVILYDSLSEEEILSGHPDFVLDCIDNIDTKVALLAACVRRGLKVLSATGAGARADPTRIRVADLRESTNDPLSRAVRHRLRKDHGIDGGIPVVFSLEKPKAKLLPFKGPSGEEENPSDYQIVPGFRVRIIPVLGTIPAIFGQVMASYVATQLAGLQVQMEPVVNFDTDHYRILHQRLIEHEELLYGTSMQVEMLKKLCTLPKSCGMGEVQGTYLLKMLGVQCGVL